MLLDARNIADQIAHLHNVRVMWLEVSSPAVAKTLPKIPMGAADKPALKQALAASGTALGEFIAEGEKTGKVKGQKRGAAAFFGYAMAHEAHHRGPDVQLQFMGVAEDLK